MTANVLSGAAIGIDVAIIALIVRDVLRHRARMHALRSKDGAR